MRERIAAHAAHDHCVNRRSRLKGEGQMTTPGKSALLVASLTVAALVSAPAVDARPTCQSHDVTTTTCSSDGHVSIRSRPGTVAPPANRPVFPWLGLPGR